MINKCEYVGLQKYLHDYITEKFYYLRKIILLLF